MEYSEDRSYYDILEVAENATIAEIKKKRQQLIFILIQILFNVFIDLCLIIFKKVLPVNILFLITLKF